MAELSTVARPYAEAIIKLAVERDAIDAWSGDLMFLTEVMQNANIASLIANPNVDNQTLTKVLLDICSEHSADVKNLLRILVDNKRLSIVPHIAVEYERLKAEQQNILKVDLVSGYEVSPEQQQELQTVLKQRFGKQIQMNIKIDASIIGGWVIRAGDKVIDASVKGRLQQLATELSQ